LTLDQREIKKKTGIDKPTSPIIFKKLHFGSVISTFNLSITG